MAGRGRLEVTHTQVALWDRRPLVDVVRDETESTPLWLLAYSINAVTPEDDVGQHTYRYLKKRAVTSRVQTGRRMNKQEGISSLSLHLLFAQIVPCLSGLLRENFTLTTIASRANQTENVNPNSVRVGWPPPTPPSPITRRAPPTPCPFDFNCHFQYLPCSIAGEITTLVAFNAHQSSPQD